MSSPIQLAFQFEPPAQAALSECNKGGLTSEPRALEYQLKVSVRARQVTMRVVHGRGLLVTVPKRFARKHVPAIIEQQRAWIESALADLDARTPALYREWPPRRLKLAACQSDVKLVFTAAQQRTSRVDEGRTAAACVSDSEARWRSETQLELHIDPANKQRVAECIAAALKGRAHKHLSVWLANHARSHGLHYKRLSVRGQRTLWGSYSSSGTLSLNYKLLFLPNDLVNYVMLHELAHTRHLDHSPAFWRLLDKLHPNARELDKALSSAGELVPPWLELAS